MPLVDFLRQKWRLMRTEREKGEASRRKIFESLRRTRDREIRRNESIKRLKVQQKAEEDREKVREEAYLLWEADGKPEGRDEYYWILATNKVNRKYVPIIYKPYYLLEKIILEPIDKWISRQAFFTIATQLAILAAIIAFIGSENTRRNNEVFSAWQTITSAEGQSGSGGRIEALEFLNSRPLKFPWIGWTEKGWYWDEGDSKCKFKRLPGLRWERQSLASLSAPNAYLGHIHLCGADLAEADLNGTNLWAADLSGAYLIRVNLNRAFLVATDLREANLYKINLSEAYLATADLNGANLNGADLNYADLSGADLRFSNLNYADLNGANLFGADLRDTDFVISTVKSRDFDDKYLMKGIFESGKSGTYIIQEPGSLVPKQVESACFWQSAKFDPGFEEKIKKNPIEMLIVGGIGAQIRSIRFQLPITFISGN